MQKVTKVFLTLLITLPVSVFAHNFYSVTSKELYVYYGNNKELYADLEDAIKAYGITPQVIQKLDKTNEQLHLIFDAQCIPFTYFPKNYIVYQALDLDTVALTQSYLEKLANAVAVWDPSYKNINKYGLLLEHYYHFDKKHLDPLLLPCFLPLDTLPAYKEILRYSNKKDTDISSHLPALFAHCVLQQPKFIIELGVRSGESSYAFKHGLEYSNGFILGIDIDEKSSAVYPRLSIKNAEFKNIDDRLFPTLKNVNEYQNMTADIVFIDTSHYYDHTIQELEAYVPLLEKDGLLIFHDTNMCPLRNCTYQRINNTCGIGWDNEKGVARAIKDYFMIDFNEAEYTIYEFSSKGETLKLLHYPYCNGLTLIKKASLPN